MSESARVEVLCAEVRVLQMGNGQITLSMYRQLDQSTFERFEPFGRVRDNEREPPGREPDSWWAATPRPARWFAATPIRPTGQNERDPLNMRIGCCTPSSRVPTSLPAVRTGTSWSGPGTGWTLGAHVLARSTGMSVRPDQTYQWSG